MKYICNTFYSRYIVQDQLASIVDRFNSDEREKALQYVQNILNYTVWQLICQLLSKEDHNTFFTLQTSNFSDDSLIDWLQERNSEITMLLPEVIERSLGSIINELDTSLYDNS